MTPAPMTQEHVVTRRVLRSDGVATRRRIIESAVALARDRPLAELTMRDIAREADVSPATAYTYFSSKEQLFAEAYLDGVQTLTEHLRAHPPSGDTAADRVAAVLRRAVKGAAATGDVVQATAIALASSDPAVAPLRPLADDAFAEWIAVALGGATIADHDDVVKLLQLAMFASFVAVAHGRQTLAESGRLLDLAVRRLVVET